MFSIKKTAIMALLLSSVGTAQAALISTDWKVSDDKKATLDTTTGIEWMKTSQTQGLSISEVQSQLSSTFAGWRLPTKAEVNALFASVFSTTTFNSGYSTFEYTYSVQGGSSSGHANYNAAYGQLSQWLNVIGMTQNTISYGSTDTITRGSYLWYNDETTGQMLRTSVIFNSVAYSNGLQNVSVRLVEDSYNATLTTTSKLANTAVYLVNDGGVTLSSLNDPSLNINNPRSPINNISAPPVADVSVPFGVSLFILSFVFATSLSRKLVTHYRRKGARLC